MKPLHLLVTAGLLSLCLTSCRTTRLLNATFESDALGGLPTKSLPGDPVGDSVAYQPVSNPRLQVQNSPITSGRKALFFSQAPLTGTVTAFNQWLSFKGIPSNYDQTIWFYWTGKLNFDSGNLLIDIQGIQSLWVARLKIFGNGEVWLIRDVANEQNHDVLGTLNRQAAHSFIFTLNPQARTFNILLTGAQGRSPITRTNLPVIAVPNPAFSYDFERPSISFRYENASVNPESAYIFEDVYISRKQPD